MYARPILFCVAIFGSLGAGQAYTVHGTPAAAAQEATKSNAGLCGTGVVCYWLDGSRPSRTPQGYAGLAG